MKNASVRRDEDELRVMLEGMKAEVEGLKARTGELWAGVGAVKARRAHASSDDTEATTAASWAVADEDGLRQILEVGVLSLGVVLRAILTDHDYGRPPADPVVAAVGTGPPDADAPVDGQGRRRRQRGVWVAGRENRRRQGHRWRRVCGRLGGQRCGEVVCEPMCNSR